MTTVSTDTTDLYPSRVDAEPSIAPRLDPVVHPSVEEAAPGPLDHDALRAFDRDGFLFLPDVFSADEMAACRDELDRLRHDERVRRAPQTIVEPASDEVRSIFEVHLGSEILSRLIRDRRIVERARQILGSDVYIHQSRVNLKPGLRGKEFYWHSDFETWHVEDGMPAMRALSCSVALTENNEFNGPLMVVPGSHRRYVACVGETPERHYEQSLKRQEYGVPDPESLATLVEEGGITAPKGGPGSIVIFDCNAMHGSGVNLSPHPRSNVFAVYNSVENTLIEPFSGQEPRPLHIASRDFTPVEPVDAEA
ncbi:MAG TPA: ectoine hydroxylase [Acidimicrobiales bacterium]|nr:ectoine hydroxylase [Acidimicrobiales bacterium]